MYGNLIWLAADVVRPGYGHAGRARPGLARMSESAVPARPGSRVVGLNN